MDLGPLVRYRLGEEDVVTGRGLHPVRDEFYQHGGDLADQRCFVCQRKDVCLVADIHGVSELM